MEVVVVVCFILIIMFPFTAVYADYQVDALYAFKKALHYPTILSNWTGNSSLPCSWEYIRCNSDDAVITVDLVGQSLAGSLVPDLGNLSQLEYLKLHSNQLNGSIPAELGKLINLLSLNLGNNSLTGPIPPELGNLTKLTWLLLNDNNLSGGVPFPDPLTNLFHNITYWNLSGSPSLCGNLTNPYNACTT